MNEVAALLIVIFLGLLAVIVLGKLISWALRNNTPAVLLFFVVPILAYIAYNI